MAALWTLPASAAALKKGDAFPPIQGIHTGRVTLVDFWASWCGPCKASFPAMQRLFHEYKGKGFEIVAISVDENEEDMQQFLQDHPVDFRVLHDEGQKLVSKVDIPAMPTSFLLDKRGRVVSVHEGFEGDETENQLAAEIANLLKGDKP
jgi:thiol-disulfide isomerase/thioredoxin